MSRAGKCFFIWGFWGDGHQGRTRIQKEIGRKKFGSGAWMGMRLRGFRDGGVGFLHAYLMLDCRAPGWFSLPSFYAGFERNILGRARRYFVHRCSSLSCQGGAWVGRASAQAASGRMSDVEFVIRFRVAKIWWAWACPTNTWQPSRWDVLSIEITALGRVIRYWHVEDDMKVFEWNTVLEMPNYREYTSLPQIPEYLDPRRNHKYTSQVRRALGTPPADRSITEPDPMANLSDKPSSLLIGVLDEVTYAAKSLFFPFSLLASVARRSAAQVQMLMTSERVCGGDTSFSVRRPYACLSARISEYGVLSAGASRARLLVIIIILLRFLAPRMPYGPSDALGCATGLPAAFAHDGLACWVSELSTAVPYSPTVAHTTPRGSYHARRIEAAGSPRGGLHTSRNNRIGNWVTGRCLIYGGMVPSWYWVMGGVGDREKRVEVPLFRYGYDATEDKIDTHDRGDFVLCRSRVHTY
ncbi:hypothetical protein DFP72DRAFT_852253 [Ephemerocybe angulata]|uniref:Uncharacterized protein n=1 Tax=Ephemerocybe angulata TaxID=980116 RepID=A0A8H6M1D1_9AGAR|nr:hypothetical protein DFP72DRAFT_852253 [Tulosesus angulatus]